MEGHSYDGIKEYDNPMPGWWVWTFIACIVFSAVYLLGVHVFGFINTYEDDLAASLEQLEAVRAAYASANPTFQADEETLAALIADPASATNGAATYATYCAACHGDQGQGLIGPNLTDAYWLNGGTNVDIFEVITSGVPAKGMPAWENALSPEQRGELLAYIRSLAGTEPPGAKEPQGELVTLE